MDQAELERRAERRGLVLPAPPAPQGAYRPAVVAGGMVFTSGMGPMLDGTRRHLGYVGADVTTEEGRDAARIAVVNALMAAIDAAGGIENIASIVRVTGFVRSAPGFIQQTKVVDAASEVLHDLLGEAGAHARSAVGVAELPFGIPVEIELTALLRGSPAGASPAPPLP